MAHELIGFYTIADNSGGILKVMRSYQYYAVNAIAYKVILLTDRIEIGTQSLKEYRNFAEENEWYRQRKIYMYSYRN